MAAAWARISGIAVVSHSSPWRIEPETHDARDRFPGPVDEVAVGIESHADTARVHRRDIGGQQVRPERRAVQGPPIPRGAGCDHNRVTAPAHRSVARRHNQFDATSAQRHIGDLARLDDQLAAVDRGVDRIGDRGRHAVAKDLPLPQVLAQEPALVLPAQRPPQPGCARSHRVDHLSPVRPDSRARRDPQRARHALAPRRPRQRVHRGEATLPVRRWRGTGAGACRDATTA